MYVKLPSINFPKKNLYVGFEDQFIEQQNLRNQPKSNQPKYYDEFPAYYLDLLPLPSLLKKEQLKNYTILQFKTPNVSKIEQVAKKQIKPQMNMLKIPTQQSAVQTTQIRTSKLLKRLIKRVKILIIILEFYKLLLNSLQEKIEVIKKYTIEDFRENIAPAQKLLQEWVQLSVGEFLKEISKVKESLQLRGIESYENRKKIISTLLGQFVQGMLKIDIAQYFTKQLAFILSFVTQSYQFPQKKFYFKFEMQRIRTTMTGSLGVMEAPQQKMVLFVLLIVKSILFNSVMKYSLNDEDEHQFTVQTNCMILTSIIHEMVIQWIEKHVRRKRGLDFELMKQQFSYLDEPLTMNQQLMKQQAKTYKVNQLIDGILTDKSLIKYIYDENGVLEDWFIKYQTDLVVLIDQIHDQLNKEYQNKIRERERVCSIMAKFYQASLYRRAN